MEEGTIEPAADAGRDVVRTAGSPALLEALTGYRPETGIREGMTSFIDWYLKEVHPPSERAR